MEEALQCKSRMGWESESLFCPWANKVSRYYSVIQLWLHVPVHSMSALTFSNWLLYCTWYIKRERQCFITRWNTEKRVENQTRNTLKFIKNTPLRVLFSTLSSVFHLVMKHCVSCLIYYVKRSRKKGETFIVFRLRFRRADDSAYDSDFLFPQGHKRSYVQCVALKIVLANCPV